jgi:hypothetical protein
MSRRRPLVIIGLFFLVLATIGNTCGGSGGGSGGTVSTSLNGFGIQTLETDDVFGFPITTYTPNTLIQGYKQADLPGATGDVAVFQVTTGEQGLAFINSGRAPAVWLFYFFSGPCYGLPTNEVAVQPGALVPLICIVGEGILLGISPNPVAGTAPPSPINLTGSGIDATYGLPKAMVFDDYGNIMYTTTVDAVSSDGTWTCFSGLPALYTGTYVVVIKNVQADGTLLTVGAAPLNVYGNDPPGGIDPGGDTCGPHGLHDLECTG